MGWDSEELVYSPTRTEIPGAFDYMTESSRRISLLLGNNIINVASFWDSTHNVRREADLSGATDTTAILQYAIDEAKKQITLDTDVNLGRVVYLPKGFYKISDALLGYLGVTLIGDGPFSTRIVQTNGAKSVFKTGEAFYTIAYGWHYWDWLRDMALTYSAAPNNVACIQFAHNARNTAVKNLALIGKAGSNTGYGILSDSGKELVYNLFDGINTTYLKNTNGAMYFQGVTNANRFSRLAFYSVVTNIHLNTPSVCYQNTFEKISLYSHDMYTPVKNDNSGGTTFLLIIANGYGNVLRDLYIEGGGAIVPIKAVRSTSSAKIPLIVEGANPTIYERDNFIVDIATEQSHDAVYAAGTQFSVVGDVAYLYGKGRLVWVDNGVDGWRSGHVVSAVYSAPNTTVTLTTGKGNDPVTANCVKSYIDQHRCQVVGLENIFHSSFTERIGPEYYRRLGAGIYHGAEIVSISHGSGSSTIKDRLTAIPVIIGRKCILKALALDITIGAVGNAHLAIYSDAGSQPSAKLGEATINTNATGIVAADLASLLTLQPGLYWLVALLQADITCRIATVNAPAILGKLATGSPAYGYRATMAYGALPANYSDFTLNTGGIAMPSVLMELLPLTIGH